MREGALDIETTGLEYKEGHKIIEIACVELLNFIPTGKIYQTFINPERKNVSIMLENRSCGSHQERGIGQCIPTIYRAILH